MQMRFLALCFVTTLVVVQASLPTAHGFIRVVQENGIWWFQDDTGRNFFSLGVNCVAGCYGHAEETALVPARKARIVSLLREWGFNTAASWSSPSVWDDMYVADQIYPGFIANQHDVFDEAFWSGVMVEQVQKEVQPFLGRKNFIGYFLDNEPTWDAQLLFEFYGHLAKDKPGSLAFITYLTSYYKDDIQQLNHDWGTAYTSFDAIPGSDLPKRYSVYMQQGVLQAWRLMVATTYYRRYAAMVRALDPDHLILGIRYQGVPDMALFKALTPYFDVNSLNDYNRYGGMRPAYAELYQATGKPLLLTEFSFSGYPHPGRQSALFVDVYSQENRGIGYHKSVQQAAQAPFMVGMHWFMWMDYTPQDQAMGGYVPDKNVGLVSHDESVVYEALGQWIKRTNTLVDSTHRKAHLTPPPVQQLQRQALRHFVPTVDGDVAEWPPEWALRPTMTNSLLDRVQTDHRYFLSWDTQHVYLAGDISAAYLESPPTDWTWEEGDYLSIHLGPAEASHTPSDSTTAIFISPIGGGVDGHQPYVVQWFATEGYRQLALSVKKRHRPGGYTFESRIPVEALGGVQVFPGAVWHMKLIYQNVTEIYQMQWEGLVTLQP